MLRCCTDASIIHETSFFVFFFFFSIIEIKDFKEVSLTEKEAKVQEVVTQYTQAQEQTKLEHDAEVMCMLKFKTTGSPFS